MDELSRDSFDNLPDVDSTTQRHDSRDSLFLVARFRRAGETRDTQVRVRNLSAGGLMAELAEPIDEGTPVELEVRGIGWVSGRIAWTAVGRAGVEFEHTIDPLRARKPVGRGRKVKNTGL